MKCNGGEPISLSAVRDALYLRPLILGLSASISDVAAAKRALPPDASFTLAPVSADLKGLNRLRETQLWVPEAAPDGVPVGGIPMLEAVLPLGLQHRGWRVPPHRILQNKKIGPVEQGQFVKDRSRKRSHV
jgi:hypothetical protein